MNNRIIKFRAWDERNKEMIDRPRLIEIRNLYDNGDALLYTVDWSQRIESQHLLQFTGLKDKKDKEIYEGDIVKIDDRTGEIVFFDGSFWISFVNSGESVLILVYNEIAEVIGNIFENPELLNKNS